MITIAANFLSAISHKSNLIYVSHIGRSNGDLRIYRSRRNVHFVCKVRTLSMMEIG